MEPVKNKKITYLLICAVAAVWGIIVYRVLFNADTDDYQMTNKSVKEEHEPYDQYVEKPDTFKLALNYRDPFLGGISKEQEITTVANTAVPANFNPPPPPPVIDWGFIKYAGYIVNPATKKLVSILTVNGIEQMVAEGEILGGVKLIKNKRDSVLVSWQGKTKYIKQ